MSALVTSSDKELVIRRGGKEDCAAILDFVRTTIPLAVGHGALGRLTMNFSIPQQIQQLADYEKEPDAVKATVETVSRPEPCSFDSQPCKADNDHLQHGHQLHHDTA